MRTERMDAHCRIDLFGPVRLVWEDRVVSRFATRKAAHLLACLALPPGRSHTREALVDRFWPDVDIEPGRDSLSAALSAIRKALEPGGVPPGTLLIADRQSVRLDAAAVTTDVQECERLLRRADQEADPGRRADLLESAVGLYQGELVQDCYDDWLLPEQRRWAERHVGALLAWSQALEACGRLDMALEVAARASAADPLREEACAARVRLYAALGRFADARACYREYERRLREDSGASPPAALLALVEGLRADRRPAAAAAARPLQEAASPVPAPPAGMPGWRTVSEPRFPPLPHARSRLFGRKTEVARAVQLLADDDAHLVTITGPGGSGKTRLATEVARLLADGYRGRAAFVALESVDQPGRIAGTLVRALGIPCRADELPEECAAEALGPAPCLLVLDNFEQLLAPAGPADARGVISQLLTLMPELHLLVTSRQALAIEGERELRLAPLSTPAAPAAGTGTECESVAMFVDRAQGVDPSFSLTDDNRPEVEALCERLEGLPLAIEMAAAWTRVLSPKLVRERLERQPTELSARRQDAPLRHRSLRATLEWSYELLPAELRSVFAALSVFRDGWTLAGAEAVVGECALDALADLAERSLLVVEEAGSRYRYLGTVREYACERLKEHGDEGARERHARHFLRHAQETVSRAPAQQYGYWRELGREYANLHAALEWLEETGRGDELALAAAMLEGFWLDEGNRLQDGAAWLERALALHTERDAARAAALRTGGRLSLARDQSSAAREQYEESLSIARELGDTAAMAASLIGLTRIAAGAPDAVEARRLSDECVALLRTAGDPRAMAAALVPLCGALHPIGGSTDRESLLRECASLMRATGMRRDLCHPLYALGLLARDRGEAGAARALWEECVAIDEETGVPAGGALWGLGMLAESQGDMAEAARWFGRSLRESLACGSHPGVAEGLQAMAKRALARGLHEVAARLLGAVVHRRTLYDQGFRAEQRRSLDAMLAEVRAALGSERCEALLQEGWRMAPEAAIDLGLAHLVPGPADPGR